MCINITCIIRSTVSFVDTSYSRPIILWLRLIHGGWRKDQGGRQYDINTVLYGSTWAWLMLFTCPVTSFIHPADCYSNVSLCTICHVSTINITIILTDQSSDLFSIFML